MDIFQEDIDIRGVSSYNSIYNFIETEKPTVFRDTAYLLFINWLSFEKYPPEPRSYIDVMSSFNIIKDQSQFFCFLKCGREINISTKTCTKRFGITKCQFCFRRTSRVESGRCCSKWPMLLKAADVCAKADDVRPKAADDWAKAADVS